MDIKKLTPLVITGVLIILAIMLYINNNKKISAYQTLTIKYNNQNYEYENFIIDSQINFEDHIFYIVSTNGTELAFNTSEIIKIDKKNAEEVIVKKNNSVDVCFEDKSCATFSLK